MSRPQYIPPDKFNALTQFFKTFNLTPLPVDILNKLKPGRSYDIQVIYERLKTLEQISCELEYFKYMLDQEEGFIVKSDYVIKEGKREREDTGFIDPDIE